MKRWQKISGSIGIGLIVLGVGVGVWQKDYLASVYKGIRYAQTDIEVQVTSTKEDVSRALEDYNLGHIRDLTVEEEEQIRKGELSVEEAVERIMAPVVEGTKTHTTSVTAQEALAQGGQGSSTQLAPVVGSSVETTEVKEPTVTNSKTKTEQEIVANYTTQMYTLKAKYLGLLGSLEREGLATLSGIPKEKRTFDYLQSVGMPYLNRGLELEKKCNAEVDQVIKSLEKELRAIGADRAIVATMRSAYHTEKQLKIAYYISKAKSYL